MQSNETVIGLNGEPAQVVESVTDIQVIFEGLHSQAMRIVNRALFTAKNYNIHYLQLEDPDYSEIVSNLYGFVAQIETISEFEGFKLKEIVDHMDEMAKAISEGDTETLAKVIAILDKKPLV